jgi:NAD kinase
MNASTTPRVILVTRPTDLEELLVRHGTRDQARFFLETRQQRIEEVEERHRLFMAALNTVLQAIPLKWRRARIERGDLAGFVFEPEDLILVLGQDGLVANASKYLEGQLVLGINPDPDRFEGVLVPHTASACADLLQDATAGRARVEERTMVEAQLDDGQKLLALNELFLGHRSHQSARYRIRVEAIEERHSSSGLIVATGTGSTGWAKSIHRDRHHDPSTGLRMPAPSAPSLVYFIREAWPSRWTQAKLTEGILSQGAALEITSEMNEDGVIFGDGIEADRLEFTWGMRVVIRQAAQRLKLVTT